MRTGAFAANVNAEDSALYSTWGDAQILFPAVIAAAFGQYWARS